MFFKSEIKTKWFSYCQNEREAGRPVPEASLNLALLIASSALIGEKTRNGHDYMNHPLFVATHNTDSMRKRIVGILHDVVEDSDWTLDDLIELGFSKEIISAVDAVTKRDGEKYVQFIERCGCSGLLAIDVKLKDLHHNSMGDRTPSISKTEKQAVKSDLYNICYYYLLAIKKGEVAAGTKLADFILSVPAYSSEKGKIIKIYEMFSAVDFVKSVKGCKKGLSLS